MNKAKNTKENINNLVNLCQKLIQYPSITPKEAGAIEFIKDFLTNLGFTCHLKKFGPEDNLVTNLYAVYGSGTKELCFAGHVDVVPTGEEALWSYPPFSGEINNDILYGRGAVDMKGAIAAFLYATKEIITSGVNLSNKISFLITSDEEGDAKFGTKEMLKWMEENNFKPSHYIIGEPTCSKHLGDIIKIGRRGSINFDLTVKGIMGHVAYPTLALNPNKLIIDILHKLQHIKFDQGNEYFQPTNLEVTSLTSNNNATNVIPEQAEAKFNIRFNNNYQSEKLVKIIHENIKEISDNFTLNYSCSAESFMVNKTTFHSKFAEIVEQETKITPEFRTDGGTSDARFIQLYCKEILEFGLLNDKAHKIDEAVKISDLQSLYNVYYMALCSFC